MQKADRSFETNKQKFFFLFEYLFDSVTHQVITNSVNLTPKKPHQKQQNQTIKSKRKTKQNKTQETHRPLRSLDGPVTESHVCIFSPSPPPWAVNFTVEKKYIMDKNNNTFSLSPTTVKIQKKLFKTFYLFSV